MATYAIYSYEIQEGKKSLFYKDSGVKAIDMANEIVSNILKRDFIVLGKKRKKEQRLINNNFT